jgi:hypothetical protein
MTPVVITASVKHALLKDEYGAFPVKIYGRGLKQTLTKREREKWHLVRGTSKRPDV